MEATSMIMMNPSPSSCCLKKPTSSSIMGFSLRNSLKMGGFCDEGQLDYYKSSKKISCGGAKRKVKVEEKKKKKKGGKLLKGLSRDLSMFYGMGFGLDSEYYQQNEVDHQGLADQVKFKMMSEAAELLLEQLKQVREAEKESKKKMKMEEKKKRKAEQKSTTSVSCMESSSESSSSESSESESDNEMVVDLNSLKLDHRIQSPRPTSICTLAELPVIVPSIPTLQADGDVSFLHTTAAREEERVISGLGNRVNQEKSRVVAELGGMVGKKIEVCMGGKCKKSGAATLMEEFQRAVGFNDDISVSGCKCMGKCRDGPNVRVVNSLSSEAAPMPVAKAATPGNPLCLGVGVEDVGLIVANFFGDESQNGNLCIHVPAL